MRLTEGRQNSARVYACDPIEVARAYQQAGAELIHVVDLDGAFLGAASQNRKIVRLIASQVSIPVEVGGGVRTIEDIRALLSEGGVRYVIVGTLAVEQPDVVRRAIAEFGDALVVGIDARGRDVATHGWTEASRIDAFELAERMAGHGVRRIIYTDIARDGRLEGPNFEMTRELARRSGLRVTVSGGVSSLEDIARLCELETDGVDSVIVGKALYEGRFAVEQAIATARKS